MSENWLHYNGLFSFKQLSSYRLVLTFKIGNDFWVATFNRAVKLDDMFHVMLNVICSLHPFWYNDRFIIKIESNCDDRYLSFIGYMVKPRFPAGNWAASALWCKC